MCTCSLSSTRALLRCTWLFCEHLAHTGTECLSRLIQQEIKYVTRIQNRQLTRLCVDDAIHVHIACEVQLLNWLLCMSVANCTVKLHTECIPIGPIICREVAHLADSSVSQLSQLISVFLLYSHLFYILKDMYLQILVFGNGHLEEGNWYNREYFFVQS